MDVRRTIGEGVLKRLFPRGVGRTALLLAVYQIAALVICVPLLTSGFHQLIIPPGGKHLGHDWATAGSGDGREDWAAAKLFVERRSPYTAEGLRSIGLEQSGFGHPPTTAFWFIPVADLSLIVMAQVVALAALLVLLVHVRLCVRELGLPSPLVSTVLIFSAVFSTSWMVEHLHVIQISEFIAFCYVLSWYHLRHDREELGGAFLGLACTFKLFPGVMVIYLLLARRWRAAIAAVAAYLPIAGIMTWAYGLDCWRLFFAQQGAVARTWIGHIRNASVHGIVLRLLTPTCMPRIPPSRFGTSLASAVAFAVLVLVAALLLRQRPERRRGDLWFALFSVVSPFVNPWVWEHYRVLLILPLLIIANRGWLDLRAAWLDWARSPEPTMHVRQMPLSDTLAAVVVAAALVVVMLCLSDHMWDKVQTVDTYQRGGQDPIVRAWLHRRLHLLEVVNWLPWPLTIATLLFQAARADHAGLVEPAAPQSVSSST